MENKLIYIADYKENFIINVLELLSMHGGLYYNGKFLPHFINNLVDIIKKVQDNQLLKEDEIEILMLFNGEGDKINDKKEEKMFVQIIKDQFYGKNKVKEIDKIYKFNKIDKKFNFNENTGKRFEKFIFDIFEKYKNSKKEEIGGKVKDLVKKI